VVLLYYGSLSQSASRRWFWGILLTVAIVRLLLGAQAGLGVDESHYVVFSRHLAWGYVDHPPMVAFLGAVTSWMADYPLAARIGPVFLGILALAFLRCLLLVFSADERLALAALLATMALPYQHLLQVALLPDALLSAFWCFSLFASWQAITRDSWGWTLAAGLAFGCCLLSKYHGILLAGCLFLYLLFSPRYRVRLVQPKAWCAVLIGLTVFMPNVFWNMEHDWISYRFQLSRGGGEQVSIDRMFEVLGAQLGVWSPLMPVLLWMALTVLLLRPREESDRFLFWTSAPVFLFFYAIGMSKPILPHWVGVGWWSGSAAIAVVVSRILGESPRERTGAWRRFIRAAAGLGLFMSLIVYLGLAMPVIAPGYNLLRQGSLRLNRVLPAAGVLPPLASEQDITNELFGWEEASAGINALLRGMPRPDKTFVVSDRFYSLSQLGVYLPRDIPITTLRGQVDQYRLWTDNRSLAGWDALFIGDNRYLADPARYGTLFERMEEEPTVVEGFRGNLAVRRLTVHRMYGYSGGLLP